MGEAGGRGGGAYFEPRSKKTDGGFFFKAVGGREPRKVAHRYNLVARTAFPWGVGLGRGEGERVEGEGENEGGG